MSVVTVDTTWFRRVPREPVFGLVRQIVDPMGNVTDFAYDHDLLNEDRDLNGDGIVDTVGGQSGAYPFALFLATMDQPTRNIQKTDAVLAGLPR